jgi:hypothetical protein
MAEQGTHKPLVGGSNPPLAIGRIRELANRLPFNGGLSCVRKLGVIVTLILLRVRSQCTLCNRVAPTIPANRPGIWEPLHKSCRL